MSLLEELMLVDYQLRRYVARYLMKSDSANLQWAKLVEQVDAGSTEDKGRQEDVSSQSDVLVK